VVIATNQHSQALRRQHRAKKFEDRRRTASEMALRPAEL
jgi:hypothetical protein